jgi:hypothetical protein
MRPPTETAEQIEAPTEVEASPFVPATGAEHVILQRDARKCEDWSGQHPALFKRYLGRLPKNLKPGATLHGANLRRAGAIDRLPLYQCRMRPGPRKLKQSLPVIVGFGVAGRKHRLFSVLPELICYRHGHRPVRPVPISSCAPWR